MNKKANIDFIFDALHKALARAERSEHPVNKIGAALYNFETPSAPMTVTCNERPRALCDTFPFDMRIGASSQTVHAEINALFRFKGRLMGSHMWITDPFCPNCAKMMAQAGVRHIYIDKKGIDKDWASRRADEFKTMSLRIAQKAGIEVDMVDLKARTIEPIFETAIQTRLGTTNNEFFDVPAHTSVSDLMGVMQQRFGTHSRPFALAITGSEKDQKKVGVLAFESLPPGFSFEQSRTREGKYRYPIDPVNNLLITLKRQRLSLYGGAIGSSHLPSSRAFVNAIGLGVKDIYVNSLEPEHDVQAPAALDALRPVMTVRLITQPGQSQNT